MGRRKEMYGEKATALDFARRRSAVRVIRKFPKMLTRGAMAKILLIWKRAVLIPDTELVGEGECGI